MARSATTKSKQVLAERIFYEQRLKARGSEARVCLEAMVQMKTRKVLRFRMVYINPLTYAGDNGRVLGYDNSHNRWHRHFLGTETPLQESSYEDLVEAFQKDLTEVLARESRGEL